MWLYQNSYHFVRGYSSFSSEWWYEIDKDGKFWLYAMSYIILIDILMIANKIFKDKITGKETIS